LIAWLGEAAARDEVVDMGMILKLPAPGMENASKAGQVGAYKVLISGQFFEGLGGSLE
jgi:hypothetical protein